MDKYKVVRQLNNVNLDVSEPLPYEEANNIFIELKNKFPQKEYNIILVNENETYV